MDIIKGAIMDKLAGELRNYVGSYIYSKEIHHKLEYTIDDNIINQINKSQSGGQTPWDLEIAHCEDINYLPDYQQKLIKQYLPTFFKNNPQFKGKECLNFRK